MRLLLDSSVWKGVVAELSAAGHDVVHVQDIWQPDPGDDSILEFGFKERRTIVTRDKDFGELAVLQGRAHAGIIRLWDTPSRQQAKVVLSVLKTHEAELNSGAIVTASPYRIRIRVN